MLELHAQAVTRQGLQDRLVGLNAAPAFAAWYVLSALLWTVHWCERRLGAVPERRGP